MTVSQNNELVSKNNDKPPSNKLASQIMRNLIKIMTKYFKIRSLK